MISILTDENFFLEINNNVLRIFDGHIKFPYCTQLFDNPSSWNYNHVIKIWLPYEEYLLGKNLQFLNKKSPEREYAVVKELRLIMFRQHRDVIKRYFYRKHILLSYVLMNILYIYVELWCFMIGIVLLSFFVQISLLFAV